MWSEALSRDCWMTSSVPWLKWNPITVLEGAWSCGTPPSPVTIHPHLQALQVGPEKLQSRPSEAKTAEYLLKGARRTLSKLLAAELNGPIAKQSVTTKHLEYYVSFVGVPGNPD